MNPAPPEFFRTRPVLWGLGKLNFHGSGRMPIATAYVKQGGARESFFG